jgi:hypothetical protein
MFYTSHLECLDVLYILNVFLRTKFYVSFQCFGVLFARHFLCNFDLLVTVSFQYISNFFNHYILIVLWMYPLYVSAIHLYFIFYRQ